MLNTVDTPLGHNALFVFFIALLTIFSMIIGSIILPGFPFLLFYFITMVVFLVILISSEILLKLRDNSILLVLTLAFSAFQNLYIGYFVNDIDPFNVKIITTTTFIYPVIYLFTLIIRYSFIIIDDKYVLKIIAIALILSLYSGIIGMIYHSPIISAMASFRNFISPILFTLIGIFAAKNCNKEQYIKYIVYIGIIVIIIGIIERIIFPEFWQFFNAKELFEKKGIWKDLSSMSVPYNWISSDFIHSYRNTINFTLFKFFNKRIIF